MTSVGYDIDKVIMSKSHHQIISATNFNLL